MIRRSFAGPTRLVAILAVLLLASGALVASTGAASDGGVGIEQIESEIEVDDVLLAIELEDDGDAAWTIEYRTRLDTDDREAAFDDLQADIQDDPEAYTETFEDRMVATAADASDATGREMAVTEMTVRAERRELPREYGVITYTFRWSNFAAIEDDELTAGDAIDGLFLDGDSALRISWSEDWERADASPPPTEIRDNAVVWQGPTSFAGGEPRLRLVPSETVADDGVTNGDGTDPGGVSDGDISATTIALLVVLAAIALISVAARRGWIDIGGLGGIVGSAGSSDDDTVDAGATSGSNAGATAASGTTATDATKGDGDSAGVSATDATDATGTDANVPGATATDSAGSDAETADDGSASDAETADDGSASDADAEESTGSDPRTDDESSAEPFGAGVDPDLLSNEEKVLKLIEANGGRMKQKRVAEELDWTAAKTSQVTKGLREDGELEGFRLGRENVLALPEEDPR